MKMSSGQHAHFVPKVGSISSNEVIFYSPVFAPSYLKILFFFHLKVI